MTKQLYIVGTMDDILRFEDAAMQHNIPHQSFINPESAIAEINSNSAILASPGLTAYGADFGAYLKRHQNGPYALVPSDIPDQNLNGLITKLTSGHPRTLLVEDHRAIREICTRALDAEGHQVFAYDNADDALEHVHDVHLVISDVEQPHGNGGYRLCEDIRTHYNKQELSIILMSGLPMDDDRAQLANAHLSKPFDTANLINTANSLLPGYLHHA